jgi:hypothetical protein
MDNGVSSGDRGGGKDRKMLNRKILRSERVKGGDATASQLASKAETEKDGEVMRIGVKTDDELDSCSK